MLCRTPMCKASWDFSLTTIFPSLARDDVRFNFADCAVVSSGKNVVARAKSKAAKVCGRQERDTFKPAALNRLFSSLATNV